MILLLAIMADEIVEHCSKLSLLNEEEDVVELDDTEAKEQDEKLSL